jgi:hypothetical protein
MPSVSRSVIGSRFDFSEGCVVTSTRPVVGIFIRTANSETQTARLCRRVVGFWVCVVPKQTSQACGSGPPSRAIFDRAVPLT